MKAAEPSTPPGWGQGKASPKRLKRQISAVREAAERYLYSANALRFGRSLAGIDGSRLSQGGFRKLAWRRMRSASETAMVEAWADCPSSGSFLADTAARSTVRTRSDLISLVLARSKNFDEDSVRFQQTFVAARGAGGGQQGLRLFTRGGDPGVDKHLPLARDQPPRRRQNLGSKFKRVPRERHRFTKSP